MTEFENVANDLINEWPCVAQDIANSVGGGEYDPIEADDVYSDHDYLADWLGDKICDRLTIVGYGMHRDKEEYKSAFNKVLDAIMERRLGYTWKAAVGRLRASHGYN